jgi:hypothetical protein
MPERNLEPDAFRFLQRGEDAGKIGCRRITLWSQHAHQALGGNLRAPFEVWKSGRGLDIIAENGLAGRKVSADYALDGLAQIRRAQLRIALCPRPNGSLKSLVRGIIESPVSFFVCMRPSIPWPSLCPVVAASSCRHRSEPKGCRHPCRSRCGSRGRNRSCIQRRRNGDTSRRLGYNVAQ